MGTGTLHVHGCSGLCLRAALVLVRPQTRSVECARRRLGFFVHSVCECASVCGVPLIRTNFHEEPAHMRLFCVCVCVCLGANIGMNEMRASMLLQDKHAHALCARARPRASAYRFCALTKRHATPHTRLTRARTHSNTLYC